MTSKPATVTFDTTLTSFGNKTGIVVPPELIARLDAGQRPPVHVTVNGYVYRNTVGVMGGTHLVSVSADVRSATGLKGGDAIHVQLAVADSPRKVEIPTELKAAFRANPDAKAFFDNLSNSLQRYHVDTITAAKTPETRQRRVAKSIELFLAGKKR